MNSLHRLGELWRRTFINSPIGIAITSTTGKFVMVNQSLCELLGYAEEELTQYRWQDLTHPEDLLQESALIFDIATGDRHQFAVRKRYIRKDQSIYSAYEMVAAIRNPDGVLQYLLSQSIDITELLALREIANLNLKLTPELKTNILLALQQGEYYLEYEPIICLRTNEIAGHEGLIRWQHPDKGKIAPLDWIPACEEDPFLMEQICSFVVSQGVLEARKRETWISVNISPSSLHSPAFFALLSEIGWTSDRPRIYLEITERAPLNSSYIEKLQLFGYGVLLDDFGQGHSSLIQLLQMLDRLHSGFFKIKIDGWFTANISNRSTQLVMAEFINILHELGLEVIAECIETEAQLTIWRELGVDYGQGWYWI